jgi:ATP-dependent DNA helicase DinG
MGMENNKLDAVAVADYLSQNGAFAKKQDRFEERESQMDLAVYVSDAFNEDGIGVFEAGTGVGKSFAYLIPALLWQAKTNERVVISTGTINLQQQLIEKDIPAAMEIVDKKAKAVLVKGRQQYLCRRRLRAALDEGDLFDDGLEGLERLASWAGDTKDGSRSSLDFQIPQTLWQRVNSESDGCMGQRCAYRGTCFVTRARQEAQDAGILVVNHHLLFADVEARLQSAGLGDFAVLPAYERLIFDEAHAIEEAATSFFSADLTRFRLLKQLNRLSFSRGTKKAGALHRILALLPGGEFTEDALGESSGPEREILSAMENVREALSSLDAAGLEILGYTHTLRLTPLQAVHAEGVFSAFRRLFDALTSVVNLLADTLAGIDEARKNDVEDMEQGLFEARLIQRRLTEARNFCENFLAWDRHGDSVFWLEKNRLPGRREAEWFTRFVQTPLEIASKMNEGVFSPVKTVVCTSATLKSAGSFGFWMDRTGAAQAGDRVVTAEFPSPFPYASSVLFAVPTDAPAPQEEGFQRYVDEAIPALIEAASGRTLVLCTAYDQLRLAWESASAKLISRFTLLRQGDDDRARLLEKFKADFSSVLFATDSFWTGIDVPGESLSQVIIVKLPFSVPSDPVMQARCEALEQQGKSAFLELSVPAAVIKFRQGFGRLIRHSGDKGVITVLDRRIISKNYGRFFVESVPETRRRFAPTREIVGEVERFLPV